MLVSNLPALQVVLPLIGAPICACLTGRHFTWLFTCLVVWLSFAIAIYLTGQHLVGPATVYYMGGWWPPYGIEYNVDILSSVMLLLVTGIASISILYAKHSVDKEIPRSKQPIFFATFLLCFTGLLGIIITNDIFNIYVFLEISSLATYALIAMGKDRRALMAGFEYLVLGSIGATFILIAIGLVYLMTGTLNITDLSQKLPIVWNTLPVKAALAFFTIGLMLKMAMFPLHLWLVNGYTNAPSFISVFLSATATKVSIYLLIRILFGLFDVEFSFSIMPIGQVLTIFALLAILVGSFVAMFQHNVKRILAYSSVAQIGYIVLAISLATNAGVKAAMIHILNHAVIKAALFMAAGCVMLQVGGVRLADWKGLGKHMPYTMAAFCLAAVGLIGMPLTSGFISKWYLLTALFEKQQWLIVGVVLVSSIMAVIYVWRIIEVIYFQERSVNAAKIESSSIFIKLSMWVLVTLVFVFGIYTDPIIAVTDKVSLFVLGSGG